MFFEYQIHFVRTHFVFSLQFSSIKYKSIYGVKTLIAFVLRQFEFAKFTTVIRAIPVYTYIYIFFYIYLFILYTCTHTQSSTTNIADSTTPTSVKE